MKYRYLFILLFVCLVGCEKILGPDPANTPENNFEIFWKDFNLYYAQFQIRHIDWDSVYAVTRPQISQQTTDKQLYGYLAAIIRGINDMHVDLSTPLGYASWALPHPTSYPSMWLINPCKYLQCGSPQSSIMEYRLTQDPSIGYIRIWKFGGGGSALELYDDRYLVIDYILRQFKDTKGLLIDVRGNQGGEGFNAEIVADRFADKKRLCMKYCKKIGPGKNDFSEWINHYTEPKGAYQYLKPVVVLTSRETGSAAEYFVMAMKVLPHVTIMGDTTGGGFGLPIYRELPNGWTYRLATEIGADADGYIIEGMGIPPDIPILTTVADSINGIDRIIEKGIEIIENSKSVRTISSRRTRPGRESWSLAQRLGICCPVHPKSE
jgi:carboxyl-terminal processing protease